MNDTLPRRIERVVANLARSSGFVLGAALLGALAGVVWWAVTPLPAFTVNEQGQARATQRDLTLTIAPDAWYSLIGLVAGAAIGIAAWRLFRRSGWGVAVLTLLAALAAGLVCWFTGHRLGPDDFAVRVATAEAGDVVPIELSLRAKVALMVWPFAAVLPVLVGSSLGEDPEVFASGSRRSEESGRG